MRGSVVLLYCSAISPAGDRRDASLHCFAQFLLCKIWKKLVTSTGVTWIPPLLTRKMMTERSLKVLGEKRVPPVSREFYLVPTEAVHLRNTFVEDSATISTARQEQCLGKIVTRF